MSGREILFDFCLAIGLLIVFTVCLAVNRKRKPMEIIVQNQTTRSNSTPVGAIICHVLALLWSLFCLIMFLSTIYNVPNTGDQTTNGLVGVFAFMLWGTFWFFPTVGLEVIAITINNLSGKKNR